MCSIDINDLASRLSHENGIEQVSHDANTSKGVLYPPPRLKYASALQFASGAISGPISRTLTAPLDNLRLAIQISPHKMSLWESWQHVMTHGGIRGLWRGNGVNVFKVGPEMAIRFSVYDKIKTLFHSDPQHITTFQRFLSGATGGICGQVFIFPIDVLKTRMMVREQGEFNGAFHALKKIYIREGIRAFYRGYASSVAGIIPYTGVDLSVYETLKNKFIFSTHKGDEKPADWKFLICACISITSGQYVSYPFYLVKSRQQAKSIQINSSVLKKGLANSTFLNCQGMDVLVRELATFSRKNFSTVGLLRFLFLLKLGGDTAHLAAGSGCVYMCASHLQD